MALVRDLSQAQLAFEITGGAPDQFLVVRYRGSEGLCQLYRFEIVLVSSEESVAFDDMVGKPATLSINTSYGSRWFHGIISRFELTDETVDQMYYRAELVPSVWILTHRYHSRIFQEKSLKDIITQVLTEGGIPSDRFDLGQLQEEYSPIPYCVQYRETDYNFICRLMEEAGIRWYFEQTQEAHVLKLADKGDYPAIEGEAKLPYHAPTGMNVPEEHVFRFRMGQCVRPGAVVLNDYNFENPKLKLESKGDCSRDAGLVFSDFPGEYLEQGAGQKIATLRAEEFESARVHGTGMSNSPRLAAGKTFELIEHTSDRFNGKYTVIGVTHQGKSATTRSSTGSNGRGSVLDARIHQSLLQAQRGDDMVARDMAEGLMQIAARLKAGDGTAHRAFSQWLYHAGQVSKDLPSIAGAQGSNPLGALTVPNLLDDIAAASGPDFDAPLYECCFECVPSSVAFRPPRVTPWPVMRGTQTAVVVGPGGEEIHTDEYGRVKVQFRWDREGKYDEKSSCWIRVSQAMAGGAYGIMFLPRVGQEVIVDYEEGNPDKPFITGRAYNADQMPPYKLPDEKTKSVIKTNSSKGGGGTNELRFEDLKDKEQILLYGQKDLHIRVNNDRVENIDHDRHLTVKENKFELIKKAKNVEVKLDFHEKIGGNKSLDVAGDVGEKFGGNHGEDVTGSYYLKAGKPIVIESGAEITLKVGGNFVKIDSSGVTIQGTQVKINSGGSAGSGTKVKPKKPEETVEADSVEPGKDVTYSGGDKHVEGAVEADIAGYEFQESETTPPETSWIEVELVDQEGKPVPHQRYRVTEPDGKVHTGSLNKDGLAHVQVKKESTNCKIEFPEMDKEAWGRGGGTPSQGPQTDGGTEGSSGSGGGTQDSGGGSTSGGGSHGGGGSGSGGGSHDSGSGSSSGDGGQEPPGAQVKPSQTDVNLSP